MTQAKRHTKIRHGSRAVDVLLYTIMALLALVTVYPVVFILSNSLSDPQAVMKGQVWLWPVGFSLEAYGRVLASSAMIRAFFNSVTYTVVITAGNVLVSLMCAFGLSKKDMLARKPLMFFIVLPMWFSAGLIPSFITMTKLGLYGSLWAVFLPSMLSIYNIILARTFVSSLPGALMEAAQIDGASVPRTFFQIVVPLSKPIIAVLGLYTALAAWNTWFAYLIYVPSKPELHPLQYFLVKALLWGNAQATLELESMLDHTAMANRLRMAAVANQLKYAVVIVTTVPIMLVYPFVQKYFVQGAMLGSLKE